MNKFLYIILISLFSFTVISCAEKVREDAFSFYFGEIIKNRRKELHMSQENLAEKVGKKRPYISRIENGEDIRLSNFALLANALGISIELKTE